MAVRFQSQEWADEMTRQLRADESAMDAAAGFDAALQLVTPDAPGGGRVVTIVIADGVPIVVLGPTPSPDATITHDYQTAREIDTGELLPEGAFRVGLLKISGQMARVMALEDFIEDYARISAVVECTYE